MEIMDDPYQETPDQHEAEVAKVVAFFQSSSEIPADLKPELIKKASEFVESQSVQSGHHHYGGQLGWTRWIVRNDQLNLVSSLAPGAKIFGSGQWKEEQVLEILRKFKAFAVRDGSVEEFVKETADGRFSTNGI
jgi:hypothetical protein